MRGGDERENECERVGGCVCWCVYVCVCVFEMKEKLLEVTLVRCFPDLD